jgi:5'-methylthioadenosine phosphorylase
VVDQFIDFTKNRLGTYSADGQPLYHTDMTEPYDSELRRLIMAAADAKGLPLHRGGTYVCTEGPRFETAAEIRMFQTLGGHVVGMTAVPEVVLAAELEIPYAALCVVTNYAAGMAGQSLTYEECAEEMERRQATLLDVFLTAAKAGKLL